MKVLSKESANVNYDATIAPALTIAPEELFQLHTNSILTHPESFPDNVWIPVTGPVYVESAKPGTVLKVDIVKLELTGEKGAIITLAGKGGFASRITESIIKDVPYDDKYVYFNNTIRVPLRPMIGKIGVTPGGDPIRSSWPGPHGGNMDITEISEGCSVYLPVFVDGALLACGDVHAAMGDGESIISAVETESLLTLRCHVINDMKLTHPMVLTPNEVMTIGEGQNLEEAYRIALDDMVELISNKLGLGFVDAAMIVSVAADLRVNQIVNPKVGVRVALPLSILPSGSLP